MSTPISAAACLAPAQGHAWTPTQLAEMLSTPDQPVTRQWVLGQMAAGNIPSIKVGRYRWYTAECAAELARRIDRTPAPTVSGWSVVTRKKRAS